QRGVTFARLTRKGLEIARYVGERTPGSGKRPDVFGASATASGASSCRDHPQLGLVSSLRPWSSGAGSCGNPTLGGRHCDLNAVLWLAVADCGCDRGCSDDHGRAMGRRVPTL